MRLHVKHGGSDVDVDELDGSTATVRKRAALVRCIAAALHCCAARVRG